MTTMTKRADTDLKTAVVSELAWVPSINSTNIGVAVTDGAVTLSGEVDSYPEKRLALKAVQRVRGVTGVAQELSVRNTAYGFLNDTDIARNAAEALDRAVDVPDTIKVSVHDHVVTLAGEASQHERAAAERAVRSLSGVHDILNAVLIRRTPDAIASRIQDAIGDAFTRNAVIDRSTVRVSCAPDGAVTLDGSVRSFDERSQAEYAAWAAPGVSSVTDNLRVWS